MIGTLVRRAGFAVAAGVLLGATWTGTAAASTATSADAASPAASGRTWCGFDYDPCVQALNITRHNGFQTSPLYWAGTDNTCIPEHTCNGYWFDWWE